MGLLYCVFLTRLRASVSGLSIARFSYTRLVKTFLIRSRVGIALLFGAVLATAFSFWPRTPKPAFYFEVTMRSSLPGFAQLFYDAGSAVKEADSVRLSVEGGNRDADYKFPLPEGRFTNFRFDPTDQGGSTVILSRMRIAHRGGDLLRTIQPSQLKPSPRIDRLETTDTEVTLTSAAAGAASFLTVELGEPLVLKSFARDSWRTFARRFLLSFLLASALGLLAAPVLPLLRIKSTTVRWGAKVRSWVDAHPQQAVLVVAALFVILSCYPVVFFGKSFVSPNNHSHTFLLYSEMPTVPGYKDVATDDEKGSDLGAIMWYTWPTSVVESRALLKDFELPLWNRYDSTGLPLLGQGQSMFGDPLHILVLLTNGSSGWWDLKFLLAKFLFASCLGLCVLQAARHLPAALLISATGPFIGFFSYRYSHPAFFSLCYAPSILLCWFKLIDARPGRATAAWVAAMVLADWTLINSGTVKEAYVLLLAMNFCGFLTLLLGQSIVGGKGRKFLQAFFANVLFLAIAMPVWWTFFHALQNSLTAYDAGGVWQLQPSLLIGLFDDIFYRQFNADESHLDPSLNFLTLLGVLWFLFSPRRADQKGVARGLSITCILALLFVFGIIPPSLIVRLPLLRNILHIDNTFSCVAIVCLLLIAGFGIKAFWSDCQAADFKRTYRQVLILLAGLAALYIGTTEAAQRSTITLLHIGEQVPKSNFFWGYFLSLAIGAAMTPWFARRAVVTKRGRASQILFLALLFVLFHWRHGMHLATPFDAYIMNPQRRVNLIADSSAALRLVKTRTAEPSRSVGFDSALFPGYGGAVDIEQMDGPDAILNKHYRALMDLSGAKLLFSSWRVGVVEDQLALEPLLFNMLNVRYYLGYVGPDVAFAPSLRKIASLDMDVYESEHVWPRAFFTDGLATYEEEPQFIELLKKGDGAPFAAVSNEELGKRKELTELASNTVPSASRQVTPARDYVFTSNTTSFKVAASRSGVVVLTEAFVPGDFQVRLNGKPADYFRVNSAFKGLFVPKAGDYTVSYAYWPHYFTPSLLVAGAGVTVLLCWLAIMTKGGIRRTTVS